MCFVEMYQANIVFCNKDLSHFFIIKLSLIDFKAFQIKITIESMMLDYIQRLYHKYMIPNEQKAKIKRPWVDSNHQPFG